MARTIRAAVETKKHALIEAGTGSGKSFGYLIPALESGKKTVISTGTIALQEQLLNKDLPFLSQAYGREIKVALAKGRSNYACLRKLDEAFRTLPPSDPLQTTVNDLIELSHSGAWDGDRQELPFSVEPRFWLDALASDAEDCLGPRCPNWGFTPHRVARAKVEDAQIIVANHALYFTDLALGGGVLPHHELVIFDEAHHLERAALGALSVQVSRWMGNKLLQRVQRRFRSVPLELVQDVTDAETDLMELVFRRGRGQFKIERDAPFEEAAGKMQRSLERLSTWLSQADVGQMTLLDEDAAQAKQRAETVREQMTSVTADLARRWDYFATLRGGDERASWMVLDPSKDTYELQSAPLDVGKALDELLWSKRTCVMTSATLAVDGKFDFLKRELGLPDETLDCVLGSPFDFSRQALLYIPRQMPMPNDAAFSEKAADEIERILRMSRGRAFVLCTSYRSLREISQRLGPKLPYPSKTQEDLPRARLVEWFKTTPNAVLFATGTFWEGVDIPGDALSCVIIDKLPFANPDDPIVQARTERMKLRSEDWFGGYMLPKAVLSLKQGFGRLIRTRTDTGMVAILDRRVLTMRYGEIVLRSLPPARRVSALAGSLEEALAAPAQAPRPPGGESWRGRSYDGGWNPPPPDLDAVLGEPRP
ncbi:MAG: ATP-dependent DNA helicase [Armatimonadota bacterium]